METREEKETALIVEMLALRERLVKTQHRLHEQMKAAFDEVLDDVTVFESRVNELLGGVR